MSENSPTNPEAPAAAWLPDPHDPTLLRYWDGAGWTGATAPRQPSLDDPTPPTTTESTPDQRTRRPRRRLVIAVLLAVTIAGTAIAGGVWKHRSDVAAAEAAARKAAAAKERREAEEEQAAREAAERARLQQARADYRGCTTQVGPLLDALRRVDARLDVGVSQSQLSSLVGAASVAYDRVEFDRIDAECASAAERMRVALNAYIGTVSTWNDCIFDDTFSCDVDRDILAGMRAKWSRASGLIQRADRLIDSLDPDRPAPTGSLAS
ncbi:hypothetical protein GCM10022215_42580 [Nocardioides fonticola]|uniref:DUF2510 domain-containing protein n=1 Tax=Nocardioides fonticola TaxID=450363 RepID=A0ABP7Y2M4_9ACTN